MSDDAFDPEVVYDMIDWERTRDEIEERIALQIALSGIPKPFFEEVKGARSSGQEPALSRPQDNSPMLSSAVREKRIAEVRALVERYRNRAWWQWRDELFKEAISDLGTPIMKRHEAEILHCADRDYVIYFHVTYKGGRTVVPVNRSLPVRDIIVKLIDLIDAHLTITELERADHESP